MARNAHSTAILEHGVVCSCCGQTEDKGGEYPCPGCGRPTLHDPSSALEHDGPWKAEKIESGWVVKNTEGYPWPIPARDEEDARRIASVNNEDQRLRDAAHELLEACRFALRIAVHHKDIFPVEMVEKLQAAIWLADGTKPKQGE